MPYTLNICFLVVTLLWEFQTEPNGRKTAWKDYNLETILRMQYIIVFDAYIIGWFVDFSGLFNKGH